jgi:hypothetical protein
MSRARWTARCHHQPRQWTATRDKCTCFSYSFPHRRGGGMCEHSPRADYYRAIRDGMPANEALQFLSAAQIERVAPL